jgi:hypothetical protein
MRGHPHCLLLVFCFLCPPLARWFFTALFNVYQWYPTFVAQEWFLYDELFAVFAFAESVFGVVASVLTFLRRRYRLAFAAAFCCMLSGTGLLTTSLIQPLAVLWQSLFLYFLPLFLPPLIATLLVYYRSAEFRQKRAG